jgi:hypothetical protein
MIIFQTTLFLVIKTPHKKVGYFIRKNNHQILQFKITLMRVYICFYLKLAILTILGN